ncbi:glycosyltransferase family 4 protein [Microbacterium sp.]|uniref:glycosyltransferase family 4 protein n=1 Tax=Microbacterium sp. TaxID=51671 RepID=UPI0039E2F167
MHLDHTSSNGGAEYALLRMLQAPAPWNYRVLLPKMGVNEIDVFAGLPAGTVRRRGPHQPAGATKAVGPVPAATLGVRLAGQAVVLRTSRLVRSADVVHANSTRAALYGAMALTGSRIPYVVHLRDLISPESLGRVGFRLFTEVALRRADGVIANSAATLASASPYLREEAASTVLPSAAGIGAIRPSRSTPAAVRTVGMVARIDHWKGQDLLIRAFARSALREEARLVLAGGTPFGMEPYLEQLRALTQRLGVADAVEFRGHVDDVPGFIDEMDVCVQCSTRPEPLGQNVLQYLSRGAVVIASNEGGPTEWVVHRQNGVLFAPRDEGALAAALTEVGADRALRARLAENASRTPGLRSDDDAARDHAAFFTLVHDRKRGL